MLILFYVIYWPVCLPLFLDCEVLRGRDCISFSVSNDKDIQQNWGEFLEYMNKWPYILLYVCADHMCAGTHIDIPPRRNHSTTKQISTTKFYKLRHLPRCRYQRTTRDIAIILGSNKVLTNLNTKIKERNSYWTQNDRKSSWVRRLQKNRLCVLIYFHSRDRTSCTPHNGRQLGNKYRAWLASITSLYSLVGNCLCQSSAGTSS